jgi:hypothetical protein
MQANTMQRKLKATQKEEKERKKDERRGHVCT